ncbi:TadG family pilus assembly protein [Roseovarius sp. SK2]|uniref:TadG family pilus assembly protein n=1 Tax=Roseovarius TaxID=74030 RepID=UPI00237A7019|nr:TadG family pilus assembly protein [Roseovarius sp. SK2]MDD9724896.1 TadG family pilus assembly protein [Roseovarius sp. SK2]
MSLTDRIARFRRDESGVVAIIVSLMLTVLFGFVALGVDVAALYRDRARLQAASDLGAMSAVADASAAQDRAIDAITKNDRAASTLTELQTGRYFRNPAIPRTERFMPLDDDTDVVNAAQVTLSDASPLHFAQIFSGTPSVDLSRTAMATRTGAASFSLNSHLADLDPAALDAVLTAEYGVGAAIGVGDLALLADARVNLGTLLDTLDGLTGGTSRNPAEVLNRVTTADTLLDALAAELPPALAGSLTGLASAAAGQQVDVAAVIGGIDTRLGLTATDFLIEIDVTALDIVKAVVASEDIDAASLDLDLDVAGIVGVDAQLTAGEPPAQSGWVALGEEGVQLHRAAARLGLDIDADPGLLTGLAAEVTATDLHVPLYVELAGATATLDEISCSASRPSGPAASFLVSHTPLHPENGTAVAALYLGTLPAGTSATAPVDPASLGFADLLTVRIAIPVPLLPDLVLADLVVQARSHVAVGRSNTDRITFTHGDVASGDTEHSYGSELFVTNAVSTLLSSENTELRIKPDQQGLVTGLAAPVVNTLLANLPAQLLAALTTPVDGVVDSVLASVGLELGSGELTLTGHHCELIRLVQ